MTDGTESVRLLLVDDHTMLRESLRRSLEGDGLVVVGEAQDGESAIALAEHHRPDVILMDVSMPGMDGVEATRQIHQLLPDVAIVMLTMHADTDVVMNAIRAGAAGYLVKDCSTSEIVTTVRQAASGETVLSPELAQRILEEAQSPSPPESSTQAASGVITRREAEVLSLIAEGLSTSEVAERLFISLKTVKNHLASIYHKLDSRDRTQAVLRAVRMGIIRIDP